MISGFSVAWNLLRTCSPSGEAWFAMKMPSFHKWGKAAHCEPGQYMPDGKLRNDTKQDSWSFLLAKYILLSEWIEAPKVVCLRKQPLPFYHIGNSYTHLQITPCELGVYRWFQSLKPYSEHFLLPGEDWFAVKMPFRKWVQATHSE